MNPSTKDTAIQALRERAAHQVVGKFYEGDHHGCAVGIMAEALGFDRKVYDPAVLPRRASNHPKMFLQKLGFSNWTLTRIVDFNDAHHYTFDEIASWLEMRSVAGERPMERARAEKLAEIQAAVDALTPTINLAEIINVDEVEAYANSKALVSV